MPHTLTILLTCYLATLLATKYVLGYLRRHQILDLPNARSSHSIPTPRGGGLAVTGVLMVFLLGWMTWNGTWAQQWGLPLGLLICAAISWLDDRRGLSARLRLLCHLLAAGVASTTLPHDGLLFGQALPFWLDRALLILGWAYFMNAVNFMDGIDGITAVETVSVVTGCCLVMTAANIIHPLADDLTLAMTGAALGFLVFNWHTAKIFLGDVGSIPLGFLMGFLLLVLATSGQMAAAIILPLYYLVDTGLALIRRVTQGKKIGEAHRDHFYQHAAARMGQHSPVVITILIGNLALIATALLAVAYPLPALLLGIVITASLLYRLKTMRARS